MSSSDSVAEEEEEGVLVAVGVPLLNGAWYEEWGGEMGLVRLEVAPASQSSGLLGLDATLLPFCAGGCAEVVVDSDLASARVDEVNFFCSCLL
jgi:hypothetical protein